MSVPEVVFVLGPPGAGKGTQCSKISEKFGYIHLSAGDLLRAERASGSPNGDLIQEYITNGQIIPVVITIKLLERAIFESKSTKILIDGFPRNKENLDGWENEMTATGKIKTKFMLFFECNEEECLQRAMGRNQNRSDDNVDSFKKRIDTYLKSTMPVVEEFRARGALRVINANAGPDAIFEETSKLFEETPELAAAIPESPGPSTAKPALPALPALPNIPVITSQIDGVGGPGLTTIEIPPERQEQSGNMGFFSFCILL